MSDNLDSKELDIHVEVPPLRLDDLEQPATRQSIVREVTSENLDSRTAREQSDKEKSQASNPNKKASRSQTDLSKEKAETFELLRKLKGSELIEDFNRIIRTFLRSQKPYTAKIVMTPESVKLAPMTPHQVIRQASFKPEDSDSHLDTASRYQTLRSRERSMSGRLVKAHHRDRDDKFKTHESFRPKLSGTKTAAEEEFVANLQVHKLFDAVVKITSNGTKLPAAFSDSPQAHRVSKLQSITLKGETNARKNIVPVTVISEQTGRGQIKEATDLSSTTAEPVGFSHSAAGETDAAPSSRLRRPVQSRKSSQVLIKSQAADDAKARGLTERASGPKDMRASSSTSKGHLRGDSLDARRRLDINARPLLKMAKTQTVAFFPNKPLESLCRGNPHSSISPFDAPQDPEATFAPFIQCPHHPNAPLADLHSLSALKVLYSKRNQDNQLRSVITYNREHADCGQLCSHLLKAEKNKPNLKAAQLLLEEDLVEMKKIDIGSNAVFSKTSRTSRENQKTYQQRLTKRIFL
jgi:hypothetical protein